ncbi:MAG TPA: O-antigen ligase family protein, partial [Longimicrobiales bacterium]
MTRLASPPGAGPACRLSGAPWLAVLRGDARYLMGLEIVALALAAPFLLFPDVRPRLAAASLALLALAWLLRWALRGEAWPHTPCNAALLLFALTIPVGVWASAFPDLTLPKLAGLILGLAAFRAVAFFVRDRRTLAWALAGFAMLGLGIVAGGALGVGWPDKIPLLQSIVRRLPKAAILAGQSINPNQLGGVMTLYVPVAAGCLIGCLRARRPLPAVLGLAGLAVAVGTLALTQSRGGWLGGAVGLAALPVFWGIGVGEKRDARWRSRLLRVAAVVVPLALFVGVAWGAVHYLGPGRIGQVLGDFDAGTTAGGLGRVSLAGRLEIWSRAVYAIQDFPFTGCGLGAFRRVVNLLYPLFLIGPDADIAHAHNIFLQTALDLGLPGLVAYLALLWTAAAAGIRGTAARSSRLELEKWVGLGLAG